MVVPNTARHEAQVGEDTLSCPHCVYNCFQGHTGGRIVPQDLRHGRHCKAN